MVFSYKFAESQLIDLTKEAPELDIHNKNHSQSYGNAWVVKNRSVALKVPSVVLAYSYNYLINPNHPDFEANKVSELGDFVYDSR